MDWPASDASVYAMIPFRKLRRSVSTENGGISRDYNADTTPIRIGVSRMRLPRGKKKQDDYHPSRVQQVFRHRFMGYVLSVTGFFPVAALRPRAVHGAVQIH
jgi:hypothetical protein